MLPGSGPFGDLRHVRMATLEDLQPTRTNEASDRVAPDSIAVRLVAIDRVHEVVRVPLQPASVIREQCQHHVELAFLGIVGPVELSVSHVLPGQVATLRLTRRHATPPANAW